MPISIGLLASRFSSYSLVVSRGDRNHLPHWWCCTICSSAASKSSYARLSTQLPPGIHPLIDSQKGTILPKLITKGKVQGESWRGKNLEIPWYTKQPTPGFTRFWELNWLISPLHPFPIFCFFHFQPLSHQLLMSGVFWLIYNDLFLYADLRSSLSPFLVCGWPCCAVFGHLHKGQLVHSKIIVISFCVQLFHLFMEFLILLDWVAPMVPMFLTYLRTSLLIAFTGLP